MFNSSQVFYTCVTVMEQLNTGTGASKYLARVKPNFLQHF